MTHIKGTTRAQTIFLRAFARNPYGPPAQDWPSPVVLRRWLKRPGFCGAMDSILRALRYQADFHLTAAAASGANVLHTSVHGKADVTDARKNIDALIHLLRMAHIRHRFAEPLPKPQPTNVDLIKFLRKAHPSLTVQKALECFEVLLEGDDAADYLRSVRESVYPPARGAAAQPVSKEDSIDDEADDGPDDWQRDPDPPEEDDDD